MLERLKQYKSLLISLCMVLPVLPVMQIFAEPVNLVRGLTAYTESAPHYNQGGLDLKMTFAFDGVRQPVNPFDRYATYAADGVSITLDLGTNKEFNKIDVYEPNNSDLRRITGIAYTYAASSSALSSAQYTTVNFDKSLNCKTILLDIPANARYLRLKFLGDSRGFNFNEIEVYNDPNAVAVQPLKLKYYDIVSDGVKLYWNDAAAKEYNVYFAPAALNLNVSKMTKLATLPAGTTKYQVSGLSPASEYRFLVTAKLSETAISESNQVNVPTPKALNDICLDSASGKALLMPYNPMALKMSYKGPTLSDDTWFNWCVSPIEVDGKFHLFTSRWRENMNNWASKGQIIHSVADNAEGPFKYVETILSDPSVEYPINQQPNAVITDLPGYAPHNARIKKIDNKYALTFILQNSGYSGVKGQKIALLLSDSINGPWKWAGGSKGYVVAPSANPSHWTYDSVVGVDNHDIIKVGNEYRIYFKAGKAQNSAMRYGYAYSASLEGPYRLKDAPSIDQNKGYIEDATVFEWKDKIYLLSTDNSGSNTGVLGYGILWKSNDNGVTFKYADAEIGFGLIKDYIKWPTVGAVEVYNGDTAKFERPAVLIKNGVLTHFFGTLGKNLDGYATASSVMLEINLDDNKTIQSVAGIDTSKIASKGTKTAPVAKDLNIYKKSLTKSDFIIGGESVELYSDNAFSQITSNFIFTKGTVKHVYAKVIAENGSMAYYDFNIRYTDKLPWDGVMVADSGNYGNAYLPQNTIDGSISNGKKWAATLIGNKPTWLAYKFPEEVVFDKVKLYEDPGKDGNRINEIALQTSFDGINWVTAQKYTGLRNNGQNEETMVLNAPVKTKYLRLLITTQHQTKAGQPGEPNVMEVELYRITDSAGRLYQ